MPPTAVAAIVVTTPQRRQKIIRAPRHGDARGPVDSRDIRHLETEDAGVDCDRLTEEHVEREPEREVHRNGNDGTGNGEEGASEERVRPQCLDERREDEEKARKKRRPSGRRPAMGAATSRFRPPGARSSGSATPSPPTGSLPAGRPLHLRLTMKGGAPSTRPDSLQARESLSGFFFPGMSFSVKPEGKGTLSSHRIALRLGPLKGVLGRRLLVPMEHMREEGGT